MIRNVSPTQVGHQHEVRAPVAMTFLVVLSPDAERTSDDNPQTRDASMAHIVIILGWLVAVGLAVHLATQAIKRRLVGGRRRKSEFRKLREFRRHHHFDDKAQRWVRKADGVTLVDEVAEDGRFRLVLYGWILFVLWEGYWLFEVAQRFSETSRLQLPYFLLFFLLVVLPLTVYLFFRRRFRRSAQSLPDQVSARYLPNSSSAHAKQNQQ